MIMSQKHLTTGGRIVTENNWTEFLESALEQFQQTVPDKIFVILDGIIVPIKLCEVEV